MALALALPVLAPLKASALLGFGGSQPTVREVGTPAGFICQARLREQDFAVVRYTGRFANGTAFDTRYTEQPLTFEVGSFYLPGVDEALVGACVGSKLRLTWNKNSPPPLSAEDAPQLHSLRAQSPQTRCHRRLRPRWGDLAAPALGR